MLFKKVTENIQRNKERRLAGVSNTISWNFPRLERFLPGIEREKFYCVTANVGVGKSKLAKYMFVISPFEHWRKNPEEVINVQYYSLEESANYFLLNILSYYLHKEYNIQRSSKELMSLKSPVDDYVIERINDLEPLMEAFLNRVNIVTDLRGPTEIYHHAQKHYNNHPDAYNIIVVDHLSLLSTEPGSLTTKDAMTKFTSVYGLDLRDRLRCSVCVVQQQAAEQESLNHFTSNKLEPSLNGLGDSKVCGRDYNVLLGLFAPARHELSTYRGYDIAKMKDTYRGLFVLKDREGESNIIDHLYFNGRVNDFKELPPAAELNYSIL